MSGAILAVAGCDPASIVATVGDAEPVVPDPNLPVEVAPQPANNNLDVARFGGRLFLAL